MRRSSIQIMRKSRISSLDHSISTNPDTSYEGFQKTKFGHRLTLNEMGRIATQQVLDKMDRERVTYEPVVPIWSEKQIQDARKLKIPEYEFLKNKQQLQYDPFLKAKMKYLVAKEKPQLIKQMPKMKIAQPQKRNTQNIQNSHVQFTTLKKQFTKENNKKLYLLTVANSQPLKVHQ